MNLRIEELQKCQLEILKEVDRVCKNNNINYCLAYGTCLGAIRHQGFIPWDDDIDICMHINDLKKFMECSEELSSHLFVQTHSTDPEYRLMITRVRNCNTTLLEREEKDRNINHGVFIDIYPLFDCPKNIMKQKIQLINSMLYRLMLYGESPRNKSYMFKMGSKLLLTLLKKHSREKVKNKAYVNMSKYKNTRLVSTLYGEESNIKYDSMLFFPTKEMLFEDYMFPVPNDYDKYLKLTYGNYMELPPKEKRQIHHDYEVLDLENSYRKYCK